jgi:hypothetical protein
MDFTAEKYAPEIEIFTLSRGFRARILRRCAQKKRFQQSVRGQPGRTDFFNTIGRLLPVVAVESTAVSCPSRQAEIGKPLMPRSTIADISSRYFKHREGASHGLTFFLSCAPAATCFP